MNTNTPRTDSAELIGTHDGTVKIEFARTLERELAEVSECNLSNCNKLNRCNDAWREAVRESARLRAALVRARDHVIMQGTPQTDQPECLAQIRAALAGGAP